ncbi:MAG: ABC transporter ATP-binding protein [Bacteroidetes bacterium]|nr:ABC transporter ATP-binding protein [Bacteroidota bacterium]MCY4234178.1 ABC transporter ATP-binding protein [Bacteroidota bacterium]
MLEVKGLTKTYQSGSHELTVLDNVSFTIKLGDLCAVVGPSGSGKTTLLGLCAGLDSPTSGEVKLSGHTLNECSEDQRAEIRRTTVGFVFQTFKLIPTLTALQNVMVPLELNGHTSPKKSAMEILNEVGLKGREHHFPVQMSGGEQQRVGIARAFIHRPKILFADEPTGNLDTETGSRIEDLLLNLNRTANTALVVVTHDLKFAHQCHRVLELDSGRIVRDHTNEAEATLD